MTTENEVKIDITANDQASAVIVEAAKNAEAAMKKVEQEQKKLDTARREAFRDTKASTEFFGTIAGMAGGSEISAVASQLASLTEKTSQFSEVAKQGGAAATALQLGLVTAAAAVGVQIGQAIGNWVFETSEWTRELERAERQAQRLQNQINSMQQERFSDELAFINLQSLDNQEAALQEFLQRTKTELAGLNQMAKLSVEDLKKLEEWEGFDWTFELSTGQNLELALKAAREQVEVDEERKAVLQSQIHELERRLGIEKELAQLQADMNAATQSAGFLEGLQEQLVGLQSELNGTMDLTAMLKNTVAADRDSALALMEEIEATREAIKARDEAAREKQRIADEEKREKQRIADEEKRQKQQMADAEKREQDRIANLKQSELDRLQEELILLEKGKEAARAFRLEKQGLSSAEAAEIAAAEAAIEQLKQKPVSDTAKIGTLQARESRLLTKSFDAVDPTVSVAKNTEQQVKSQERTNVLMADLKTLLQKMLDKPPVEVEVVT